MSHSIDYAELHSQDPRRARTFYAKLFGWKTDDKDTPMGVYTEIDTGAKVEAVLPRELRQRMADSALHAVNFHESAAQRASLGSLRSAIRERRKVAFSYEDRKSASTSRTVLPLGLFYFGPVWSLGAWCELRRDFRTFRLDRVRELRVLAETFPVERGKTLSDLFEHYRNETARGSKAAVE